MPDTLTSTQDLSKLPLVDIVGMIRKDWKPVNYAASPYLDAMGNLDEKGNFGLDTGESCVLYFLCNAMTWKGPIAREVKKELNKRVKTKKLNP